MILAALLLAAMTSADAIATLLNSETSTSPARFAEAKTLVEREAREGKLLQQFVIGVTTKDAELSTRYCAAARPRIRQLAEKTDNALAWYLLSMESNDFSLLAKAVAGGNVQALNAYGTSLIQLAMDPRNSSTNIQAHALAEGYNCFSRAAAKRDPNGFINLGTCYQRGLGCAVNLELAHASFLAAAEAGHPEGMDYVSADYEHGLGVPKSAEVSLLWRMKARAVRGDAAAAEWLKSGKGGTK